MTITETPACEGCYLKSALVNGTDAADRPFDFGLTGGVYRDVEMVVSDAGAAIEGRATDERNAALQPSRSWSSRCPATLWYRFPLPEDAAVRAGRHGSRDRPATAATTTSLRSSGFQFSPFGGELDDPDVLEPLSARAQRVTLIERERRTLTLRLTRRPDSQP